MDDTSAIWFGNELHNRRRRVDAIEAYLLACVLDPDDANGFSQVADEIAWVIRSARVPTVKAAGGRELPAGVGIDTFHQAAVAAISCAQINDRDIQRVGKAAKRLQAQGIDRVGQQRMVLVERTELALTLYERFRSPLTGPSIE